MILWLGISGTANAIKAVVVLLDESRKGSAQKSDVKYCWGI